jgi:GAF domain-containing protein
MDELAQYFADFATTLLAVRTVDATRAVIVLAAVEAIDGCDHASLSHQQAGRLLNASSSDHLGPILDRIQTEIGEGPCLYAIDSHRAYESKDFSSELRFPAYATRAVEETGVQSTIATPLVDGGRVVGALNLFSDRPGSFDAADVEQSALLAIFVAHATPAMLAALERESLADALQSRDLIGQAKGMLMARSNLDEAAAFDVLRRASQRLNIKLRDVAKRLTEGQPLSKPPEDG